MLEQYHILKDRNLKERDRIFGFQLDNFQEWFLPNLNSPLEPSGPGWGCPQAVTESYFLFQQSAYPLGRWQLQPNISF